MRLTLRKVKNRKFQEFKFPVPMYFVAKFFNEFPISANLVHTIESLYLNEKIKEISIEKPIYITGLARSGTTISLEMLCQHPDVVTHRYLHMVLPYTPHWTQQIANLTPLMRTPVERLHKDGIAVTRDSPEAVEEIFWQKFFNDLHNEANSNILNVQTKNVEFETFYCNHIKKLLFNQQATRYLAKNNYNVARLEYLQKLFPDVKFLIFIRNPFDHIASLAKQDKLFYEIEREDPRLLDWTKIIGHREFGHARVCINFNNADIIQKIRRLWRHEDTYIKGWAIYWASTYSYLHNQLQTNSKLEKASIIVRYEDLCESPRITIEKIIDHLEINPKKFNKIKEYYCKKLRKPTYYRMKYSKQEQEIILKITSNIAKKYGYNL